MREENGEEHGGGDVPPRDASRYQRLLRFFFPVDVVRRHGEEMEATFLHLLDLERSRRGRVGAAAAWLRAVADGIWNGWLRRRTESTVAGSLGGRRISRRSGASFSWLDVKLGLRMLVKYPGMTAVSIFALAIAIPAGLGPMHIVEAALAPLPEDENGRIRALRNFNVATRRGEASSLRTFAQWREELTTFDVLGAATMRASYNVISEDGRAAPVQSAEVTASTFDILQVPPLLGRTLIAADEVIGAPAVALIGYDLWQSRLDGDPDIVGRTIRIGRVPHTVVGVMPEGFLFPFRDQLWLPLRVDVFAEQTGMERSSVVFGRLKDGTSPEEAQAELTTVGRRMALEFPDTHARLQPEVVPFAIGFFGLPKGGMGSMPELYLVQILALLVLVVACVNVGMLIFTRTATRSQELAVRTALGASRVRVVSQLFTEALVFAVLAAGVGLLLSDRVATGFDWLLPQMPYWADLGVTRLSVFRALGLAVLSAAIVAVVPALKVTGKAVQQNIQRAGAGRSGIRFGGISSVLIIADVALAVATVGLAVGIWDGLPRPSDGMGSLSEQFLSAELTIPAVAPAVEVTFVDPLDFEAQVAATQQELVRRLEAEPGVRGVAVASTLPRMRHPLRDVELEGENQSDGAPRPRVSVARVAPGFFNALEQPILAGRGFDLSDLGEGGRAVIVNTTFVDQVLGGRNPIGKRVRYATPRDQEPNTWYEIVGVVGDLGMDDISSTREGLYHPLVPGEAHPVYVAIHVGADPEAFTPRLRELASEVDPAAIISNPIPLHEVRSPDANLMPWMIRGAVALIGILLALSISGIYALMSFTVAERTREIGIRTALGAQRNSVLFTVAKRSLAQLGIGILMGIPVAAWLLAEFASVGRIPTGSPFVLAFVLGACVMVLIGMLACTAPALRALRIMPTEALREGG